MKDYAIVIGRFQPFHNAHQNLIRFALSQAKQVIVVLGSAGQARNIKNPWTVAERVSMIHPCFWENKDDLRLRFISIGDYHYNDNMWVTEIQQKISDLTNRSKSICLIGHSKDASSYYLKLFPQWQFIEFKSSVMNATDIRNGYFTDSWGDSQIPPTVTKFLNDFKTNNPEEYKNLCDEFKYIKEYKARWESSPYPPIFNTVDCVVVKSGHVLVVRRKGNPGKGLVALPGGFLQNNERIVDGAIRELKEETAIKVAPTILKESIVDQKVFDHPERSLRGRTITHAFCIDLGVGVIPHVKGSDDADKAWWMPLHEVHSRKDQFFEDHYHIITFFCSKF